jgi:hypothetical protein
MVFLLFFCCAVAKAQVNIREEICLHGCVDAGQGLRMFNDTRQVSVRILHQPAASEQ